jgi:hypothetical protein
MHPSIASQDQSIPFRQSYSSRPIRHISRKTPARTHCWKRSWAVEPGQKRVASRAFHWQPVRRRKKMASMQTRSGTRGRPPPKRWVFSCRGMHNSMSAHSSSGMRQASGTGFSGMGAPPVRAGRVQSMGGGRTGPL